MAWVVDTCVILDIGLDDAQFAERSQRLLARSSPDGLVVCPVTFVELAPAFGGQTRSLEEFLLNLGIDCREDWTWQDTNQAFHVWAGYVHDRRARKVAKRPVADVLIAAFAARFEGLLTRNRADFAAVSANLRIVEP